jgi:plastocyanin
MGACTMVAASLGLGTGGDGASALSQAASCGPAWATASTPNASSTNFLYGIDGSSTNDVWAVGDWSDADEIVHPLIQHWDGAAWSEVDSPDSGAASSSLVGVAAVDADTAWAAGSFVDSDSTTSALLQQWDGQDWSLVPLPPITATDDDLYGISARSASDAWAVGAAFDPGAGRRESLVLHRNATTWSVVGSPNSGAGDNVLFAVAARAANDAWAVGHSVAPSTGRRSTLAMRWNGSAWSVIPTPNPAPTADNVLLAVAPISANDAWAVGYDTGGGAPQALALHWNGSAWTEVPVPNPGTIGDSLLGIAAVATGDVWAMGTYDLEGERRPLMVHWDGETWSQATTPDIGSPISAFVNNALAAGTVVGGQVWSAGYYFVEGVGIKTLAERICPVSVTDAGFSPSTSTIDQGGTVAWDFPTSNGQNHTATDHSGLELFASGGRGPGTSFTFDLVAAGSYSVIDETTSNKGTVKVRPMAEPPSGRIGTEFTVTWSSETAPPGYVFDTQVKRPGSASWVTWKSGKTGTKATFIPDAGTGKYSFRSRMRATPGGASSGWSPSASIQVT